MSLNTIYWIVIPFFLPDVVALVGVVFSVCEGLWLDSTELFFCEYVRSHADRQKTEHEEAQGKLGKTAKNKRTIKLNCSCMTDVNIPCCLRELKIGPDVSAVGLFS